MKQGQDAAGVYFQQEKLGLRSAQSGLEFLEIYYKIRSLQFEKEKHYQILITNKHCGYVVVPPSQNTLEYFLIQVRIIWVELVVNGSNRGLKKIEDTKMQVKHPMKDNDVVLVAKQMAKKSSDLTESQCAPNQMYSNLLKREKNYIWRILSTSC